MTQPTSKLPITGDKAFDDAMRDLWFTVYGLGDDDVGNIDQTNSPGFHNGNIGGHENIVQGTDVADTAESTATVTGGDAVGTYTAAVQALINELKTAHNSLLVAVNLLIVQHNAHMEQHRTQNLWE